MNRLPQAKELIDHVAQAARLGNLPAYNHAKLVWSQNGPTGPRIEMYRPVEGRITLRFWRVDGLRRRQQLAIVLEHWHEWLIRVKAESEVSQALEWMGGEQPIPFDGEPVGCDSTDTAGRLGLEARG